MCVKNFPRENVISDIGLFEDLDFPACGDDGATHLAQLRVRERGRSTASSLWLTVYPAEGEPLDVLDGGVNWLPVFFPVFYPGLKLEPGDIIRVQCSGKQTDCLCPDYRVSGLIERLNGSATAFDFSSAYRETAFKATPFYQTLFGGADSRAATHTPSPESAEQLDRWREVYEELYSASAEIPHPTFNPIGWNSSYTGDLLPLDQLREQVSGTVQRIERLRPPRVLEIGCGAGLLLFPLAPAASKYVGTDFSRVALDYVRSQLAPQSLTNVELFERGADDFTGLPSEAFDAIILNSVIQYFPSLDYLIAVVEQAVRVAAPGGQIFLGDVRSLPMLEAFYASIELEPASSRRLAQRRAA